MKNMATIPDPKDFYNRVSHPDDTKIRALEDKEFSQGNNDAKNGVPPNTSAEAGSQDELAYVRGYENGRKGST